MNTVEWIELGTLLVLVLFMAGVYRLLWEYTKTIQRQNAAINAHAKQLQDQRDALETYEQETAENVHFLDGEWRRVLGMVEENANRLKDIQEVAGHLGPALERMRTALEFTPEPAPGLEPALEPALDRIEEDPVPPEKG